MVTLLACCLVTAALLCGCRAGAGEEKTSVEVVAYYPFNEDHQFIADYLEEFAAAHPGEVELEVVDFRTPEGRERWMTTGLGCAGVFIDGKTSHEITRGGKTETVNFIKRMNVFWTPEDFEAVVYQLLGKEVPEQEPAEQESAEGESAEEETGEEEADEDSGEVED
jgi:ABC-type glycerol-3-phosphate transport system substrate-binding protein